MIHQAGRLIRLVAVRRQAVTLKIIRDVCLARAFRAGRRRVLRRNAHQVLRHPDDLVPVAAHHLVGKGVAIHSALS